MHISDIHCGVITLTLNAYDADRLATLLQVAHSYAADTLATADRESVDGVETEAFSAAACAEVFRLAALVAHFSYYGAKPARTWALVDYNAFHYPPGMPDIEATHPPRWKDQLHQRPPAAD